LQVLAEILTKQGYKVRITNAQMGLSTIRHNLPDVILLGVKIPEVDGYQICKTLKADEYTAEIPIIFLSPLNETINKIKAFEMGGLDYITKPFKAQEVIARIQIQLTIQQQKHHLREKIEQHQQTTEILYQSRALLASVLNSSQDGIAAIQALRDTTTGEINDFCCLVINPVFAKLFGKQRKDLIGKSGLKKLLNQLYPRLFDSLLQLGETRESVEQEFYWSNDEIPKWYYLIAVKLGDGCSITVRDITEVKQLKFKLNLQTNLA
jgi:DNA-binding response OmpR family regulator